MDSGALEICFGYESKHVHYKINLFIFSFFFFEVNIRYKCHGKV